jgi:hypothetical protein
MLKSFPGVLVMPEPNIEDPGALLRSRVPYPKEVTAMVNSPVVKFALFLNPYAVRLIFNAGYGPDSLPKLLNLQTTAAHSADNISLTSQTNSVWTEIITNNAHSTLGRSLPQFSATNTSTVFLSGFKGVTPAKWIQANIFQDNLPAHITIVDSKEETAGGGVFVQHLKPDKAAAMGISGAETILSIYSANADTYRSLEDLSRHIDSLSHGTIHSVTEGLQHLTLRATAVSVETEELLDTLALTEFNNGNNSLPGTDFEAPTSTSNDGYTDVRRSGRQQTKAKAAAAKPNHNKPTAPSTDKYSKIVSVISDDEEEPPSSTVDSEPVGDRSADPGDFRTSDDTYITNYFNNYFKGSEIKEGDAQRLIVNTVTVWSAAYVLGGGKTLDKI